ncbi:MAG: hypothetical protein U1E17_08415 [Geminicoccaceae bacterium]
MSTSLSPAEVARFQEEGFLARSMPWHRPRSPGCARTSRPSAAATASRRP